MQKHILRLSHGRMKLPTVTIDGYSLGLRRGGDFLGDTASRTAFREMLEAWSKLFHSIYGKHPLGESAHDISKKRLDEMLTEKGPAAVAIHSALEDYSRQLAHVVRQFLKHSSWKGIELVIIGGGFKQSEIGKRAVKRANKLLKEQSVPVKLRMLHHHADEGGLIGWVHLAPPVMLAKYDGFLAVDIGGTNVRCGIVCAKHNDEFELPDVKVVGRDKWGHAEDEDTTRREHMVKGIAKMLQDLIAKAHEKGLDLAPFVGVSCPGTIRKDGTIVRGAQNLPGNWMHPKFNFAIDLRKHLPYMEGREMQVWLHNDAVVQGLSELPYTGDVKRWAVLTVGTGLGNASYTNR
jgi:hypothetical protein